ncbi:monovalent cation/H+ antiporter complex subunit F [Yoonia sp.]|jgi:multicomponent Na+:H+ antiporter subunit F|uniref:monovalent cation/H+ antiporter complex subunit F n=1 Tax=Yoonia sp. TaxID=2212373 RepID=UPI002385170B|nr:monovalent cation/H+ antiporter complex subunit F [Yoonia sp.]MDE0851343.1 monovalent cation/H+ antiporter complex subunit F [Yoonia sp.]
MILHFLALCTLVATLAALPRLILGPTAADRILATQLAGTGTVATLIVLGAADNAPALFDIAMVFAALAAVTGIAFVAIRRTQP